jgi:hypothetical protein
MAHAPFSPGEITVDSAAADQASRAAILSSGD